MMHPQALFALACTVPRHSSIVGREDAFGDHLSPQSNGLGMIDREHTNRNAAERSQT
jgi:hypothetical protein